MNICVIGVNVTDSDDMEKAGDPIEAIIAAMEKVKWEMPYTKLYMIPEYFHYLMTGDGKPLEKRVLEAKEKGETLQVFWVE